MSRKLWTTFGVAAVLAISAPVAQATVTQTNVSAPASNTFPINVAGANTPITVQGTAPGAANGDLLDLRCTYIDRTGAPTETPQKLADSVQVTNGAFSYTGALDPIKDAACVLRAVPHASTAPVDLSPYRGPTLYSGELQSAFTISDGPNTGVPYDYKSYWSQFSGAADLLSVASCGVCDTYSIDPATLRLGTRLFNSTAALYKLGGVGTPRSEIQIDHRNAYASYAASILYFRSAPLTFDGSKDHRLPAVSYAQNIDPLTGNLDASETSDFSTCNLPADPAPGAATLSTCPDFAATGVRLLRHVISKASGRLIEVFDTFVSLDGAAHLIDLRFFQSVDGATSAYAFPWVSPNYATHTTGNTIAAAPAGAPATISVTQDAAKADGDLSTSQGAITLSASPSPITFGGVNYFETPFLRTIPAGGSVKIGQAFSTSFTRTDAAALNLQALSDFRPAIAITNTPASVNGGPANVTGTVTAGANDLPTSVSLNGVSVPVAANGTWSGAVPAGTSTANATTTDAFGLSATTQVAVAQASTFLGGAPPTASSASIGGVRFDGLHLFVPIICNNAPCSGKLTALAFNDGANIAKKRHAKKRRHKQLTIGASNFSIPAGSAQTIRLTVSKAARDLVAKKRRLPIVLATTLSHPGAAPSSTRTSTTLHRVKTKKGKKKRRKH